MLFFLLVVVALLMCYYCVGCRWFEAMVVVVVAVVVMAVVRMSLLPSEAPQDMAAILAEMQAM